MAQYKVPQDVEAEDKILGPLTIKQFIYGVISLGWAFLSFFIFAKINLVLFLVFMLPITGLFGLLAGYKRDGQDFESLLMSLVSFFTQPRKRIWLKEPIGEVFRIDPPKVLVEQTQRDPIVVRSQLEQLANLVDSRGAINTSKTPLVPVTIPSKSMLGTVMPQVIPTEERTVALPPTASATETEVVAPGEDMLDFQNNPSAQNLVAMVDQSEEAHRKQAIEQMRAALAAAPEAHPSYGSNVTPSSPPATTTITGMTTPPSGDIIRLATENDDLSVAQIAALGNRQATLKQGETVNLRNGS